MNIVKMNIYTIHKHTDGWSENKFTQQVISQLKNLHWLSMYQRNSLPTDYHLFPALKHHLGSHKVKDDCHEETHNTMAANTGHRLVVRGNRKTHPKIW
jgi:hypothetical protein